MTNNKVEKMSQKKGSPKQVLSLEDAARLRIRLAKIAYKGYTPASVARRFGVHRSTVTNCIKGKYPDSPLARKILKWIDRIHIGA